MKKRLFDLLGLALVGDGALTLLNPERHCLLWEIGPQSCREMVDKFVQHPAASRWAGLAEVLLGVWIAEQQKLRATERVRPIVSRFVRRDLPGSILSK